jgi:hypothetical protein
MSIYTRLGYGMCAGILLQFNSVNPSPAVLMGLILYRFPVR